MTLNEQVIPQRKTKRRKSFVEKTILGLSAAMEQSLFAEEQAQVRGLLQWIDPRVKVIGLLSLVFAAALSRSIVVILALSVVVITLALLSRIHVRTLATRIWVPVLLFTGVIALPAIFITPGTPLLHIPVLGWNITSQGVSGATYLITRVLTASTFSMLLILTTPWMQVLKALRVLRVPVVAVVILGMTYRYIFLMLQIARDMFESRQSRMIGTLAGPDQRRLAAASVGVLLGKSFQLSNDVYMAMQSRGFRGEVYTLDDFQMQRHDWAALIGFGLIAGPAFWFGA